MNKFVHLHVHSEYSLLDGLSKIPKLVTQAKIMGMDSLALTDHGVLYGAIKFYKECKKENLNPIIGCEMYIAKRSMHDKSAGRDNENFHLTVLAKDYEGKVKVGKLNVDENPQVSQTYNVMRIPSIIIFKEGQPVKTLIGAQAKENFKRAIDDVLSS